MALRNGSARRAGDIRMASRPPWMVRRAGSGGPLVRDRSRTSRRRSAGHGRTIRAWRVVRRATGPRSGGRDVIAEGYCDDR
jgi:hypothetical protein